MFRSFLRFFLVFVAVVALAISATTMFLAVKEAKAAAITADVAIPASTPPVGIACQVSYTSWTGGFFANVNLANTSTISDIDGWTATVGLSSGQQITAVWNAVLEESGSETFLTGTSYNNFIAPGHSIQFGFVGSYSGSTFSPPSIVINGTNCTVTQ